LFCGRSLRVVGKHTRCSCSFLSWSFFCAAGLSLRSLQLMHFFTLGISSSSPSTVRTMLFESWREKPPRTQSAQTHRRDLHSPFIKKKRKRATGSDQHQQGRSTRAAVVKTTRKKKSMCLSQRHEGTAHRTRHMAVGGGGGGLRIAAATWSESTTPASGRHLRSDRHKFYHVTSTDPERACDLDRRAIVQGSR